MRWGSTLIKGSVIFLILAIGVLAFYSKFTKGFVVKTFGNEKSFPNISLSTWVTDWDFKVSANDSLYLVDNLDSIQLFFGYFDEQGNIIWGEEQVNRVNNMQQLLSSNGNSAIQPPLYLTVVNDIIFPNGSSVQKDGEIVKQIASTQTLQYRFIDQVVTIVKEHNFAGLEIDFENLNDDDWPIILKFYDMLNNRLKEENIPLRVVLEPKMKLEKMNFPKNIQYVVMAYNLYGSHSGPGPKADIDFIGKLTARMEKLPSDTVVAVAVGGFNWGEDGSIKGLSENEAEALKHNAIQTTIDRDKASMAVSFDYHDENGVKHTVWYADEHTLEYWIKEIQHRGYSNIAIWRMGYLSSDSLDTLKIMK